VPSDQIYKDTLKALRDRQHFYRESLEHALSRRLEIWEKDEIARLTPAQLANNLNVLLLKLPSTNRADREQLKFFRDSGGNIVQHFPPEDAPDKHPTS
jgi:type III restriction enzyme